MLIFITLKFIRTTLQVYLSATLLGVVAHFNVCVNSNASKEYQQLNGCDKQKKQWELSTCFYFGKSSHT